MKTVGRVCRRVLETPPPPEFPLPAVGHLKVDTHMQEPQGPFRSGCGTFQKEEPEAAPLCTCGTPSPTSPQRACLSGVHVETASSRPSGRVCVARGHSHTARSLNVVTRQLVPRSVMLADTSLFCQRRTGPLPWIPQPLCGQTGPTPGVWLLGNSPFLQRSRTVPGQSSMPPPDHL